MKRKKNQKIFFAPMMKRELCLAQLKRAMTSRRQWHAYSYVRGEGKTPENIVTSGITVWRVEYSVAPLVDLTSCGIYYLFKCFLVSFTREPMYLNSVIHNQLLIAELPLLPLSSICLNAGSCWQDAGFLHHLQQRGDRVVVFSGSRCHSVVYRTCQCSDSFRDPTGETTKTTLLKRFASCLFVGASLAQANANSAQTVDLLHNVTVPNKRHVVDLWSCVPLSCCRRFSPWKGIENCPKHQRHLVKCVMLTLFIIFFIYLLFLFVFCRSEVATIHLLMRPWLSNTSSTTSLNCFLWLVCIFFYNNNHQSGQEKPWQMVLNCVHFDMFIY